MAMQVTSREYKVIVDSAWFGNQDANLAGILDDILDDTRDLAQSLGLGLEAKFDATKPKEERTIRFLDTPDFTFRQNGLVLRQRVAQRNGETEYTLKCRTEDRYVALGGDLSEAPGLKAKSKLEEDIGCPFVSRFSHSATVSLKSAHALAGENFPRTLSAAATLYSGLLAVQRDGRPCAPDTTVSPVNGRTFYERVFDGPLLQLTADKALQSPSTQATLALILWSKGKEGRTLTAEFSFRYKDENEAYSPEVASAARRFFEGVQRLDWARPDGSTKTQYLYGSA